MINHQNFSTAYPAVNKVSFDELNKFSTIPIKGILGDFETSFITPNPNNEEWKNRLCENSNSFMCGPSDNTEQNGNNNHQNGNNNRQNQDISDRVNEKIGNLKEKLDDSIFGNKENDNSQSNDLQSNSKDDDNKNGKDNNNDGNDSNNQNGDDNDDDGNNNKENKFSEQQLLDQQGEDKAKSELDDDNSNGNNGNNQRNNNGNNENNDNNGNNGGSQGNNNDDGLGIAGLDLGLNIDEKIGNVDEKIDNLKNNLGVRQQQENKDNEKNNNDQGNNDSTLGINGLSPNIQNIQANLEKQIEKLKDKFENERDNQRLIEQRNEFDDDDDDDSDDSDSKDDDDGKNYDGYGFKGDNDNGKENGEENFNFAAAGDFGCSTNTKNTVENMQSKDPEIVLALGDLSYHSTADCWFDMMSPIKDKLMVTLGHHDVEDGQAKMNQYLNSFGLEKPFYSYEYNKVHFLVMSAKSVYYKDSEQYNFILEDLKKASENEDVNWIIVSSYGPPYTSPSEHPAFKELRDVYHPIFEKYGVDLVLSGHNHNYQRTYPITYNPNDGSEPVVTSTAAYDGQKDGIVPVATSTAAYDGQKDGIVPVATSTAAYDGQKDGIVFAIVGTGGVNFYSFNGQAPYVDTQFANKFGFLNIDISNGKPSTKLTGTFYDNKGDQILDQFTIDKEIKNKNNEVLYN
jgi:hypothetical protein